MVQVVYYGSHWEVELFEYNSLFEGFKLLAEIRKKDQNAKIILLPPLYHSLQIHDLLNLFGIDQLTKEISDGDDNGKEKNKESNVY